MGINNNNSNFAIEAKDMSHWPISPHSFEDGERRALRSSLARTHRHSHVFSKPIKPKAVMIEDFRIEPPGLSSLSPFFSL